MGLKEKETVLTLVKLLEACGTKEKLTLEEVVARVREKLGLSEECRK